MVLPAGHGAISLPWCYQPTMVLPASHGAPAYHGAISLPWCYQPIMVLPDYHGATSLPWSYQPIMVLPAYHGATSLPWCYQPTMVLPICHGATSLHGATGFNEVLNPRQCRAAIRVDGHVLVGSTRICFLPLVIRSRVNNKGGQCKAFE